MLADRVRMGSKLSGVPPLILFDNGIGFNNWVEHKDIGDGGFELKTDHILMYTNDIYGSGSDFSIATSESVDILNYNSIVITYSQGSMGIGLIDNINQPYSGLEYLAETSTKKTHLINISNYAGKKHIVFQVSAMAMFGDSSEEVKIYKVEVLP